MLLPEIFVRGLNVLGSHAGLAKRVELQDGFPATLAPPPSMPAKTFLFIHDPQPCYNKDDSADDPRILHLSRLNAALNNIDKLTWPTNFSMTADVGGTAINKPEFLTIAGDLTKWGGRDSQLDQLNGSPSVYHGGWQVRAIRWLFDRDWDHPSELGDDKTRTSYPVYFGLGNHDLQPRTSSPPYNDTPKLWWDGGLGGLSPDLGLWPYDNGRVGDEDYWRYQMWNFIGQQHGGVEDIGLINTWTAPIRPVTNMDISDTAQSWRDTSYNYFVDFETFVLVQLHRFGGDTRAGHASGIDWFTNNVPKNRPLVVVQHYNMESAETVTSDPITGWSIAERDALLTMLSGYNVIALLVGHDHNTPTQLRVEIPVPGTNITFDQFRPGIASFDDREPNSHFALLRVSGTDLNVASGRIDNNDGSIIWEFGYSKALPKVGQEAPQPVCNCELSPECCSLEPGLPNGGELGGGGLGGGGLGGGGLGGGGIGGLSGGGRG